MKYILAISILLVMISCSSYKRTSFYNNKPNMDSSWIESFKEKVYLHCISSGYGNDTILNYIAKHEAFSLYGGEDFIFFNKSMRELGSSIGNNIPEKYFPNFEIGKEEQRKNITGTCLKYYASSELDSIAKAQYKKSLEYYGPDSMRPADF